MYFGRIVSNAGKEMKCYKYKTRTSAGVYGDDVTNDWMFVLVPDEVGGRHKDAWTIRQYLEAQDDLLPTWSEHYRGVIAKRVYRIPKKVLDKEIRDALSRVENEQAELDELRAKRIELYGEE